MNCWVNRAFGQVLLKNLFFIVIDRFCHFFRIFLRLRFLFNSWSIASKWPIARPRDFIFTFLLSFYRFFRFVSYYTPRHLSFHFFTFILILVFLVIICWYLSCQRIQDQRLKKDSRFHQKFLNLNLWNFEILIGFFLPIFFTVYLKFDFV